MKVMKQKTLIGLFAAALLSLSTAQPLLASYSMSNATEWTGGGDDKKKEKGSKKEEKEEEGQKSTKVKFSPAKAARLSAKDARRNLRWKEQEISTRAKTRNYFHKTFNTKFGKPTNFRSKFTRNRWRKGRI